MQNKIHIELHDRAIKASSNFRAAQAELIDILQKIDSHRAYLSFSCKDLGEYAQTYLKLSEDVAWTLIKIARMAVKVPALKTEIENGQITTSNARLILPVLEKTLREIMPSESPQLRAEKIGGLLHDAQTLSKRELEKKVASQNPELAVRETTRYIAPERVKLTLGVSEELLEKLRRVQDLESQRTRRAVSLEEALAVMAEAYLENRDPVRKAKRAEIKLLKQGETKNDVAPVRGQTIPAQNKHRVTRTLEGQCSHINPITKQRCTQKRWLDFHHIKPRSQGGTHEAQNLTLLCQGHHRALHAICTALPPYFGWHSRYRQAPS